MPKARNRYVTSTNMVKISTNHWNFGFFTLSYLQYRYILAFRQKTESSLVHLDEKNIVLKIVYAKSNGRPREKPRAHSMLSSYIPVFASHTIINPSVCLFVYLSVCVSSACLSACLCVCLCVCLSVCLSVGLITRGHHIQSL